MKQILKSFLASAMALLVLWAGNGYGMLEHSCEEHGKHQHILSSWVQTSCEHEEHHDSESHQHADLGFEASHSDAQVIFVHFYAETLFKTSVNSVIVTSLFQATLPHSFVFQTIGLSFKIYTSFTPTPVFRRTFGRFLLIWVQSFLI